MVAVPNRTKHTLLPLSQRYIGAGSVISSDCWKPYMGICDLPEGYNHITVNHSENYVDPITGCCTNTIEGSWRHLKRSLPLNVRKGFYEGYLAEHIWRKVNRDSDLFKVFLLDVATFMTR
jgi:hypothetical protein